METTTVIADPAEVSYLKSSIIMTLKINDYFNLDQQKNHHIQTPEFNFLDAAWFFSLYTNDREVFGLNYYISVYVTRKQSKSTKHDLQLDFRILRPNGSTVCSRTKDATFERAYIRHGIYNLLKVSDLNENRDDIAPDGVLLVQFTIMYNVVGHVDTAVQTETPLDKEILVNDFKNLLLREESTDVTLKVKDREFKAHRAVLVARSRSFEFLLRQVWKEDGTGFLEIHHCDPTDFHRFLTYLYCGEVEDLSMDTVFPLRILAKTYEVSALRSLCEQFMIDNLSVDSFSDVLLVLEEANDEITTKIVEFYKLNKTDILTSPNWQRFFHYYAAKAIQFEKKALRYSKKPV